MSAAGSLNMCKTNRTQRYIKSVYKCVEIDRKNESKLKYRKYNYLIMREKRCCTPTQNRTATFRTGI